MIRVLPLKGAPEVLSRIERLKRALQPPAITQVLELEAQRTLGLVVADTPKKWTGQVRRSWKVLRPSDVLRLVSNSNKIMRWLEFGTANGGTGFIYPKTKRALFIPLTRKAMYGWTPGMKIGVDYRLFTRVRGMRPRAIVAKHRLLARDRLKLAMKAHVRKALT